MKTRVNSRINNVKGKTNNSFRTRIQKSNGVKIENAIGYCLFHSCYIDEKIDKNKHCRNCSKFVKLAKKDQKETI